MIEEKTMGDIVERIVKIRQWVGIARAETEAIRKLSKGNEKFSNVALKWMDIADSLINFMLRNDEKAYHQLRCDLADIMCLLPRNTCEVLVNGKYADEMMFANRLQYLDPERARETYLSIIRKIRPSKRKRK